MFGINVIGSIVCAREAVKRMSTRHGGIHASGGMAERAAQAAAQIPMQRAGSADEIAAAIVWLLSDEASYATGAIVDVSGGR